MLAHIAECRRVVIVVIITCAKAHNRRRRRRRWVKCTSADTNKQISHMRWNAQLLRPATPLATIDNDRRRVVHNNNKNSLYFMNNWKNMQTFLSHYSWAHWSTSAHTHTTVDVLWCCSVFSVRRKKGKQYRTRCIEFDHCQQRYSGDDACIASVLILLMFRWIDGCFTGISADGFSLNATTKTV